MGKKKRVVRVVPSRANNPYAKPVWMKVVKAVTVTLLGLVAVAALASIVLRYYRHFANHIH